ncbi:hypothetical protein QRD02_14150 [Aequorivita sp. SDUM287046]|uniref:DUF4178 domain-containing protein n=1 Tax=Aequorivita aurantiaca TaxID=3053356 RepID=A0ABT8DJL5_9FLAO|nr:hypothetical protein [Aequorivita aurantiaca]MDN3725523.1 hypothetical protein [Aequorivita aurantiaca]
MTLLTIVIIGILVLAGIAFWSSNAEKSTNEFQADLNLSATEFEQRFGEIKINGGTLRFWGNWFGKPMDNYHEIKNVEFDNGKNILTLNLSEDEKLKIWNPSNLEIGRKELQIRNADKILFEWHLYGESRTEENLRFESYKNNGINIEFATDFMTDKRKTECYKSEPALSIIGY